MNGPQHYIEGTRLLAMVDDNDDQDWDKYHGPLTVARAHAHLAAAQVCATLDAALIGCPTGIDPGYANDWQTATGALR